MIMNPLWRSNPRPWLQQQHCQDYYFLFKVLRVLSFSTSTEPKDSLKLRISRAGNPKVSIIPVIEQWLEEGNSIKKPDLQNFIKLFRRHRRFSHALQVFHSLTIQLHFSFTLARKIEILGHNICLSSAVA